MIKIVESKAFVLALLTLVAAVAGYEGLNLPVATIMALLTPLMIAIGAAGWSDAVKMKAKMKLEHEVKMHALMHGNTTLNGVTRDAEGRAPRAAQAGFVRVGVLATIASVLGFVVLTSSLLVSNQGCNTIQPIADDVIHCAKAEATVVSSGFSIIQIVMEVAAAVQKGPAGIEAAVEDLIKKYGGDVVACVLDSIPEPAPVAGQVSASPVVIAKHNALTKYFAGKKIDHSTKK